MPAALALALAGCAQVEERPEPVPVDVCASYERRVDEAREGLAAGRPDEVLVLLDGLPPTPPAGLGDPCERSLLRKLHRLADEARILIEFAKLDIQVKGTAIMDPSIEVHFESRPRT